MAYPDDSETYNLANATRRQYSWLLGHSLLACPLFGGDFDTAEARDVYLPAGRWQDYETGKQYEGPTTLKNYALPIDKIPLFVGRTGILVSQDREGQLWAELFPAAMNGTDYVYTHQDGITQSQIKVASKSSQRFNNNDKNNDNENENANEKERETQLTVQNTTNNHPVTLEPTPLPRSLRFRLTPGHNYQIQLTSPTHNPKTKTTQP